MNKEESKIPTIEEMKQKALDYADSIPDLMEKRKFMAEIRGSTIEFSIIIEECFNNLISTTGKDLILDHSKKEFHLVKGIRNKKDMPKFKTKSRDMKNLIEEAFPKLGDDAKKNLSKALGRFEALRDVFAHVPVKWEEQELEFFTDVPYKHFFKDPNWKNVLFAHKEFVNHFNWLIDIILTYNRSVLFKKEIYSQILLGKSQLEIQEERKKLKKRSGEE